MPDDGGVDDESEEFHFFAASTAGQRVDLVDTVDELGPASIKSASSRGGLVHVSWARLVSVAMAHSVGVGAVEINEVLTGLGDVYEDSGQKLERLD
jgi:hypothetical protein